MSVRRQAEPSPARPRPGARSARRGTTSSLYRRPPRPLETCPMHPTLLTLWLTLSGQAARAAPPRRRPAFRRPLLEALEGRDLPSTLTVLNALDSGAGSLRDAIGHAQDGDTIAFAS